MKKGKLYLIPVTLGDSEIELVIPPEIIKITSKLKFFIVENIRTTRRFIRKIDKLKDINELTFFELNKYSNPNNFSKYLAPALNGNDIGILSEVGNPAIADPGSEIVKIAHKKNINVVPLVGPSSILLALISSGMNGQKFVFNGYLPIQSDERIKKIKILENRSKREQQTEIFMETPYRNMKLLYDILQTCNKQTSLCIAADITLKNEFIKTKTIFEWKKNIPQINKRPAIFLIYSGQ